MSTVILFSGGMDSVFAAKRYPDAKRVYVRIGAPYENRELASLDARGWLVGTQVVSCGRWLAPHADALGRVPLRNLYFAVAALAATGASQVVLGATAGETSPDKSRRFARLAGAAMSAAEGRRLRLLVPFRNRTKRQLVAEVIRKQGRPAGEWLRSCPSCYVANLPAGVAGCGACMSCVRRWVAMSLNGIEEEYLRPPAWHVDTSPKAGWLRYLLRTPVRDWPGVAAVNLDLLRALRNYET